ncbi:MAG: NAD-dependent epimerase/dehydratase family protein [Bacteroidales bacterium]|nr:NAD-dependent epimerase/dehydratase family protein [Bacteroidales bacterium]
MILITGSTGLVGTHILFDLVHSGKTVRALIRKNGNIEKIKKVFSYYSEDVDELFKKIEFVEGDLLDVYSLEEAMQGVKQVYNCAGFVSFYKKDKDKLMQVNVKGTANLVNAALESKVKKICHVSSVAALGRAENNGSIDENTKWQTSKYNSFYAISKYGGEMEIWRGVNEGLEAIIVNPTIILGSGHWDSASSKLFKTVWNRLLFYTSGINGFVDVRDVSKTMILLMESDIKNELFLINSENVSYKWLFDQVAENLGKPKPSIKANQFISEIAWRILKAGDFLFNIEPVITKETARTANNKYFYSNKKIIEAFDYKFINIEQSIKDITKLFSNDFSRS